MAEIFTQTPWLFDRVSIYLQCRCTNGNRRDPTIRLSSHSRVTENGLLPIQFSETDVPLGVAVEVGGDFSDFPKSVKLYF